MDAKRQISKPVEILNSLKAADPDFWKMQIAEKEEALVSSIANPIMSLKREDESDKTELLGKRYLCRGGALILAGPTGVGKSSLSMQLAISMSLGMDCLGLRPPKPLRVLLVQAENDDGDLAEMRDGVLKGMGLDGSRIGDKFMVMTDDSSTREKFAAKLNSVLTDGKYDVVIVDPALAYMGCDASNQGDVSTFLRNMLNPVIHKHNVGLILVHHTNKPKTGEEKAEWKGSDLSYIGAGSAEFANWARAVLGIRTIGSDTVYELVASKRGRRLGWKDKDGKTTTAKYIAYHREEGVICWREAEPGDLERECCENYGTVDRVIEMVKAGVTTQKEVVEALKNNYMVAPSTGGRLVLKAIAEGRLRCIKGPKNSNILRIPEGSKDSVQVEAAAPSAEPKPSIPF